MERLKSRKFWNHILPSVFFALMFAYGAFSSTLWVYQCIFGGLSLAILGNIFFQNRIINYIFGALFFFASCYMLLAIWDDYVDGEATKGYIFGVFFFVFTMIMSVLYGRGCDKVSTKENSHPS
ncbi:hypothetical protein LJC52_01475 [Bacteroidales bacterium OttesenSCG-928-A17]|nr:hypothetical protein [Bacteroidales bacterium OttesenSCG-928-A17]